MGITPLLVHLARTHLRLIEKMKTYSYLVVAIILTLIIVLESEASRNRRSSCRSNNQCRKTGKCIRKPNYFCGLGNLLFGRKKTCHHYECAECTKNYHCSGNQYCSGYTCVQQVYHDNQDYTTQNWNNKNPARGNYNSDSTQYWNKKNSAWENYNQRFLDPREELSLLKSRVY